MAILPIKDRRYLEEKGIAFEEIDSPQKAILLRSFPLPEVSSTALRQMS